MSGARGQAGAGRTGQYCMAEPGGARCVSIGALGGAVWLPASSSPSPSRPVPPMCRPTPSRVMLTPRDGKSSSPPSFVIFSHLHTGLSLPLLPSPPLSRFLLLSHSSVTPSLSASLLLFLLLSPTLSLFTSKVCSGCHPLLSCSGDQGEAPAGRGIQTAREAGLWQVWEDRSAS